METGQVVTLVRATLQVALLLGVPILAIATVVSLLVNVGQVLTSLQDSTIATVPRLAAVAAAAFLLLPWMLGRLVTFTVGMWSDFRPILR